MHFFAIPLSSGHEKRCQMMERLFVVFHQCRNIPCVLQDRHLVHNLFLQFAISKGSRSRSFQQSCNVAPRHYLGRPTTFSDSIFFLIFLQIDKFMIFFEGPLPFNTTYFCTSVVQGSLWTISLLHNVFLVCIKTCFPLYAINCDE